MYGDQVVLGLSTGGRGGQRPADGTKERGGLFNFLFTSLWPDVWSLDQSSSSQAFQPKAPF